MPSSTASRAARERLDAEPLRELAAASAAAELAAALDNDLQPAALSLRPDLQDGSTPSAAPARSAPR